MMRWLEPAKSVLLILLVAISFLLTWMIWTNQPNFQLIEPPKYTESKPVLEHPLEKLVAPESVIFHYGKDRHTKALSTDAQYNVIRREMSKWIFLDFSAHTLSDEEWEEIAREKFGVEVRFRTSIPISVVGKLVTFRDELDSKLNEADRIWLYYEPEEDLVYGLLLSKKEDKVVRSRTSISPKDLRKSYLATGELMPEQIMKVVKREADAAPSSHGKTVYWDMYYLPKNQVKMLHYRYSYARVDNEQMMEAFFLDQSLVRQIVERDKTVIFTDGSRSIQYRPEQLAITFTDPSDQKSKEKLPDEEKLQGAVSFINKHLGWMDDFYLESIRESFNEKDIFTFRQYLGAYPLVSQGNMRIDTLQVISEAGQVVVMHRSLLDLEKYQDYEEQIVMSGPELFQLIRERQLADTEKIRNAYLAYQTTITDKYVDLNPVWVVEVENNPTLYVPARTGQGGGDADGLE